MKILVTGAKGMLGTDLCSVLGEHHEVRGYDIDDFSITDCRRTAEAVLEFAPAVIVHAAAFTDVEACEDKKQWAMLINKVGTANVARAACEVDSLLIYMSTDYVFDGSKGSPYVESDPPRPVNQYGLTKLQGEIVVHDLAPKHLVARTSWLFGPNGRNFVDRIITKASESGSLRVVDDQRGCPTYAYHLARGIEAVIQRGLEGTVHLTNSGDATWYDLAKCAVEMAGIDAEITPIETSQWPTKARRPAYTVLASDVLDKAGIEPLPHWKEGVRDHLERRGMLKEAGGC